MSPENDQSRESRKEINQSLVVGAIAGQAGCLTILIVLAALFLGLWLDGFFDTKPLFTIILVIVSVPVTVITLFWVVRRMTSRYMPKKNDRVPAGPEELKSE